MNSHISSEDAAAFLVNKVLKVSRDTALEFYRQVCMISALDFDGVERAKLV